MGYTKSTMLCPFLRKNNFRGGRRRGEDQSGGGGGGAGGGGCGPKISLLTCT